ncbi:unnamed protein product [Boreogadus saida]
MAKHTSIVHQIKTKCSTFDCLRVEKTVFSFSCRTTDGPVLIIHSNYERCSRFVGVELRLLKAWPVLPKGPLTRVGSNCSPGERHPGVTEVTVA